MVLMPLCFGNRLRRRIGLHQDGPIGRTTMYGRRMLQIVACIYCDRIGVRG